MQNLRCTRSCLKKRRVTIAAWRLARCNSHTLLFCRPQSLLYLITCQMFRAYPGMVMFGINDRVRWDELMSSTFDLPAARYWNPLILMESFRLRYSYRCSESVMSIRKVFDVYALLDPAFRLAQSANARTNREFHRGVHEEPEVPFTLPLKHFRRSWIESIYVVRCIKRTGYRK